MFLLDPGHLLGYLNFRPGYFITLELEIYSLHLKLNNKKLLQAVLQCEEITQPYMSN